MSPNRPSVPRLFSIRSALLSGAVMVVLFAAGPAAAQVSVIYDPSFGTLPHEQGFLPQTDGPVGTPFHDGTSLFLDTSFNQSLRQWWVTGTPLGPFPTFRFTTGFTLDAHVRIFSSPYHEDTLYRRAGIEFGAADADFRYLSIQIASTGVFLDTSSNGLVAPGSGSPFIPFVTTDAVHHYRIVAESGEIALAIDGVEVHRMPVGPVLPSVTYSGTGFGDNTGYTGVSAQIDFFRIVTAALPVPEPTTAAGLALAVAAGAGGWWRRRAARCGRIVR